MTKQLVKIGLGVMVTLLALVVLWQFRTVVIYVIISLILAAALRPLVNRLVGRSILARLSWILLYLVVLVGFGFLLFMTGRAAINEIQLFAETISVRDAWSLPAYLGSTLQQTLANRLPPPSELITAITGKEGQLLFPAILGMSQGIGGVLSGLVVIVFLSLYWSINQIHFERLWLSLLPSGQRKQARGIWRTIEPNVGAYVRGEFIQSLLVGILLGVGLFLIGSPYPALLALVGALLCLIPVVGEILTVLLVLVVGLLTSVPLSLFTTLYALIILIALGTWVTPRLINRRWDNPILTLALMIALADAFGILGILVAPPISAVISIMWSHIITHRERPGASAQISDLKDRLTQLREDIGLMDDLSLPLVNSSLDRLTRLIEKAEPVLQAGLPVAPSETILPTQIISAADEIPGSTTT
jgi:predicted PurR-regulated permease PerM